MSARTDIIAAVSDAWEKEWVGRTRPDPRYSTDGDSQYPEGMVALSAPVEAQDELARRVREALREAGL